jgi:putative transposase
MYQTRSFYLYQNEKNIDLFCFLLQKAKIAKALYNTMLYYWRQSLDICEEFLSKFDCAYQIRHQYNKRFVEDFADACFDASIAMYWGNIDGYYAALKEWKKSPEKFLGMPKQPNYIKKDQLCYHFAQRRVSISQHYIKLAKSQFLIAIPDGCYAKELDDYSILPQVRFYYLNPTTFRIELVYEKEPIQTCATPWALSIDLGINNFMAIVSNQPNFQPMLIDGKELKSWNQWYNKRQANLYETHEDTYYHSKALKSNTIIRDRKIKWWMHNVSKYIIDLCLQNEMNTIYVGYNKGWKQECELGKSTQGFVQIPYLQIITMLQYKGELNGINVVQVEESYTSKCDHLAQEILPSYSKKKKVEFVSKGKRIERGLYKSSIGKVINADINGAIGIMRKGEGDQHLCEIITNPKIFNPQKITIDHSSVQHEIIDSYINLHGDLNTKQVKSSP